MKLTMLTLTGADDSVDPEDLLNISTLHPFVEWGILFARSHQPNGKPRFPSRKWLDHLLGLASSPEGEEMNLSLHLCGKYVSEVLMGDMRVIDELGFLWSRCQRVQLNTHAIPHQFNAPAMVDALHNQGKTIIFQNDGENEAIWASVQGALDTAVLFDRSHGAGVMPAEWPQPYLSCPCGYAGGLGPDNLQAQLERIMTSAGQFDIWVDMETKLRSADNKTFEIDRCQRVIDICEPWTKEAAL
jgi:hypothetical protein